MDKPFTVLDLLDMDLKGHNALNLRCLAGRKGLNRTISVPDINRPGLELSGFYDSFDCDRVQLFGHGETAYLLKLKKEKKSSSIEKLFSYNIPCVVFTHSLEPDVRFCRRALSLLNFQCGFCAFFQIFLLLKRHCTEFL